MSKYLAVAKTLFKAQIIYNAPAFTDIYYS
jgi:hypothetical protein